MAMAKTFKEHLSSSDALTLISELSWALTAVSIIHVVIFKRRVFSSPACTFSASACLAAFCLVWTRALATSVPEPYMDEIFHAPQAQRYCQKRYHEWDDKITTPPGLYITSLLILKGVELFGWDGGLHCSTLGLRLTNILGLILLAFLALLCRHQIELGQLDITVEKRRQRLHFSPSAIHTAFNIALFPVLFFFSGLYYTDVWSTTLVVGCLLNSLVRMRQHHCSKWSDAFTIFLSAIAMLFRQTNVFWVVIFAGGLEASQSMKTIRPAGLQPWQQPGAIGAGSHGLNKDPAWDGVNDNLCRGQAVSNDIVLTTINLVVAVFLNPMRVSRQIWPYLIALSLFVSFVAWNGGVVLGDKSNHIATIHFTQILYIWPLFVFFSWPLLLPYVNAAFHLARDSATFQKTISALYELAALTVSVAIVHYNTIIHPFTLADNCHYMFYVFRYSIRRKIWVRYLLILPYTLCRRMVWAAVKGHGANAIGCLQGRQLRTTSKLGGEGADKPQPKRESASTPVPEPSNEFWESHANIVPASFILIWIVATAMSLVTAPLVEPRYFIVPWLMWRLFIPCGRLREPKRRPGAARPSSAWMRKLFSEYDPRLILESVWFLAVNAATCYIFLTKPFIWRAEDGTFLEGGLQRFMW